MCVCGGGGGRIRFGSCSLMQDRPSGEKRHGKLSV